MFIIDYSSRRAAAPDEVRLAFPCSLSAFRNGRDDAVFLSADIFVTLSTSTSPRVQVTALGSLIAETQLAMIRENARNNRSNTYKTSVARLTAFTRGTDYILKRAARFPETARAPRPSSRCTAPVPAKLAFPEFRVWLSDCPIHGDERSVSLRFA